MVSRADRNALIVKNRTYIVWVNGDNGERGGARFLGGGGDDLHAGNRADDFGPVFEQFMFVSGDQVEANLAQVINRHAKSDSAFDVRRAGFEFVRQYVVSSLL